MLLRGTAGAGVGGLDAAVDAEEASGGQWWREDEGSQVGESDDGEHHPLQQQQQGVGADNAPEGEVLSEQQPQPHQPTEQQQQQPQGQQQQQAADSSSHANGNTSSLEAGQAAAAVQHMSGVDGATSAVEQEYDAPVSDVGSDEVGLPECVDAAEQVAVMVSDSSGVKQGGYGWKPEAMPRWTHLH